MPRTRRRVVILAVGLLVVGGVLLGVGLSSGGGSNLPAGLTLTKAQAFSYAWENIGGCREARLDHGVDRDPQGFVDQEHDECIPGQPLPTIGSGAPIQ